MNDSLRQWLDAEMRDYAPVQKAFDRRLMRRVPIWMALSVAAMVALGFGVGYDWQYVVKVHLLIGLGFATFIWLCFWIQTRSVSMKKVRGMYEQALLELSPSDQEAFARQSPTGHADFMNRASDKYPARLTVGPDYWLYFRGGCSVYKVSDMESLKAVQETTRVGYNVGDTRVRQNLGIGVSIVAGYREGTASASGGPPAKVYLENSKQLGEAQELIKKYCPKAGSLWGER